MKKNKLVLTSGILLIINSILSMLATAFNIAQTIYLFKTTPDMGAALEVPENVIIVVSLYVSIIFAIFQAIAFMIMGIKFLKAYKRNDSKEQMKETIIITLIFLIVPMMYQINLMSLVIIVLLSCILFSNNKNNCMVKNNGEKYSKEEQVIIDDIVSRVKNIKILKENGTITQKEYEVLLEKTLLGDKDRKDK